MTIAERPVTSAGERAQQLRFRSTAGYRLLAAVAIAGLVTLALAFRLPRQLKVATDVVGYPIYANFNIERLVNLYYLGVAFFPLLALVLYLTLSWLVGRLGRERVLELPSAAAQPWRDRDLPVAEENVLGVAVVRALAVGASIGLVVTIVAGATGTYFWIVLVAVAVAYAALVFGLAWLMRRRSAQVPSPAPAGEGRSAQVPSPASAGEGQGEGRGAGTKHHDLIATAAKLNALAAPLAILGLWAATASITVTVVSTGDVHHYPWLPWWFAIALTMVVAGWVWRLVLNAKTEQELRAIERRTLLFVTAPLALFLLVSSTQGDLGPIDVFHEGEGLMAAQMTAGGALYWRDLLSAHGFLQDVVMPLLNMRLVENSRWGVLAGYPMVTTPITFVTFYLFGAWLFERSWVFVLTLLVLLISLQFVTLDTRFVFWPLILLLLGFALQNRKPWISALLGAALAAQAILVPESAYCVPAVGLIVILYDVYHRRRGVSLLANFSGTLWTAIGGAALFAVFALFMLSQHALGDFFFYYLIFVPGHELVGGIPIHLRSYGWLFVFFALAPPLALLIAFLYFAVLVIRKRPLDVRDWVIGASAIFALPYYTKFIERADVGHVFQGYGAAAPLIFYLVYRACRWVDRAYARGGRLSGLMGPQPAARLVLVAAILLVATPSEIHTATPLLPWLAGTPDRYHRTVPNPPVLAKVGYATDGIDPAVVNDMQAVFDAYVRPGDWVFDFSNQPALVYYLLGQTPRTRYYHATMAITERAQKDLIAELKRDPPKLIVFTTDKYGLLNWDGVANMVRHYEVSQYILDNYTPLLGTHTEIIYGRTSDGLSPATALSLPLQQPAVTKDLAFGGFSCDWGYAPNFLSISPPAPDRQVAPVTLLTTPDPNGLVAFEGWAGDITTGTAAKQVAVMVNGQVVGQATPTIDRPDVAAARGKPGYATSGYHVSASVPDQLLTGTGGFSAVRVFGISAAGIASELIGSPGAGGPPLTQLTLKDGTTIPIRPGQVDGAVDTPTTNHQLIVSPPSGTTWADYRWLEIQTPTSFAEDRWAVYDDQSGELGHQVVFRTLAGPSTTIRVYIGSCAQWHGYGATPLYLGHSVAQDIGAVRLLP